MASRAYLPACIGLVIAVVLVTSDILSADEPKSTGSRPPTIASLRDKAYQHQKDKQWCEAQKVWQTLRDRLARQPATDEEQLFLQEASRNLQVLEPLCKPRREPVEEIKRSETPGKESPAAALPPEEFSAYYPPGRKVRSLLMSNLTGEGSNQDWGLKGNYHFAYQYRLVTESEIKKNTGNTLTAEISFPEVAQTLAVSRHELELALPRSPILGALAKELEDNVLNNFPVYVACKKLAWLGNILDPRGRRTLTRFAALLRRNGVRLGDNDEFALLAARIEKLQGTTVEIEYVSGFGVTHIKMLKGEKFDRDDLDRLAYNLSVLLDYYVFPGANKQPGEKWQVRAEDVAGLVTFGWDVDVSGKLILERGADRRSPDASDPERTQAVLNVVAGEVNLRGTGRERLLGTAVTRTGVIYFSERSKIVREARFDWGGSWSAVSTDHLLFQTENLRNVKVNSYYEATRLDDAASPSSNTKPRPE